MLGQHPDSHIYIEIQHRFTLLFIFSASAIFYIKAERIRSITKPNNPDAFLDGDIVIIKDVIDGDELLIEKDGVQTNLRLLGIKSFNPSLSDPLVSEFGQVCFQYLISTVKDQKASIKIPEKRVMAKADYLGLFLSDKSRNYQNDLSKDLISKGYSMVYPL